MSEHVVIQETAKVATSGSRDVEGRSSRVQVLINHIRRQHLSAHVRGDQSLETASSIPAPERPNLSSAVRAKARLNHLKEAGKGETGVESGVLLH